MLKVYFSLLYTVWVQLDELAVMAASQKTLAPALNLP